MTNGIGNPVLPLYDFFIALKQNDFSVSPRQIADCNRIINEYAPQVQNEEALCAYLSAVIANTREEQVQFKELFQSFYKEQLPTPPPPVPTWKKRFVNHIKVNIIWWLSILLVLMAFLAIEYFTNRVPAIPVLEIEVYQADSVTDGRADVRIFSSDTSNRFNVRPKYDWGDGSAADSVPWHHYKRDGQYRVKAGVIILYNNKPVDTATAFDSVSICVQRPQLKIKGLPIGDIVVGSSINFSTDLPVVNENDINWVVTGDTVERTGKGRNFTVTFTNTGSHSVSCSFSPAGSFCTAADRINLAVKDTHPHPPVLLAAAPGANEVAASPKVNPYWYYLTVAIVLIGLFLTAFFAVKWNKARKNITPLGPEAEKEYQKVIAALSGQEGSRDLVFTGKNYLPLPEKELGNVARMMRMRINDETPFMDIPGTIQEATENAGFFKPVYSNRTKQCEYLVLLDDVSANSQQVKLFEYLLELLVKQNVFIEKYYYRRSPAACYNAALPHGISLEKLSEKYPRHVLLIMGNAYQLLYDVYPIIDRTYLRLLQRWQHKAIITPVSFIDWGNKEKKALNEELPVVPVDIPGQLLLMKKLFIEEINITAALHQYSGQLYESESLDFEDIDELYEYCETADWANNQGGEYSNVLFQWIAALATWPKINWEMTLAIGKAIMDKQGLSSELNFTSLLRIARIKWMREGRFPDYTRTALLKTLTRENEIVARETILLLLNEIPEDALQQDHFAYEEKETQRLINEFILYAYDPEKYASYKRAKDVFGKMNANGEIMDQAVLHYLDNPRLQWNTLINTPVTPGSGETTAPSTLTGYFTAESGFVKKVYLWCTSISAVVFLAALFALVSLIVMGISGTKRFPYFMKSGIAEKNIHFTVSLPSAGNTRSVADTILTVDTASVLLDGQPDYIVPVRIGDSLTNISISIDGNTVYDTMVKISKDAYVLSSPVNQTDTVQPPPERPDTTEPGKDTLPPDPGKIEKAVVFIEVSDNSLIGSANQFRRELAARNDLDVKAVTIKQYSYNSEITYYDAGMLATANRIREYYNKYYPSMNVQAKSRLAGRIQNSKNTVVVWIKKLEAATTAPAAAIYKIQYAKLPPTVKQGSDMSVAFEIAATAGTAQTNPVQQSGSITGTICINEGNICTSFYTGRFSNGSRSVVQQLNTKGLPPGKYLVNAVIPEFKIDQVIGTFTVESIKPVLPVCDTISSVISRGQGDISKSYYNTDMERLGIKLELMSLDEKKENADFVIQKEGCREEKLTLYTRKSQTITFCDGSKLTLLLKRFRKNQTAAFYAEIMFDAVYCDEPKSNIGNPPAQMKN